MTRRPALLSALSTVKGGIAGLYLLLLVAGAVFAPWLAPYPYDQQELSIVNQPPRPSTCWAPTSWGGTCCRAS